MKKIYVTFTQGEKKRKAVLDENQYRIYSENPEITDLKEYVSEVLMERAYTDISKGQRKTLLD